jgi:hypothetical protein
VKLLVAVKRVIDHNVKEGQQDHHRHQQGRSVRILGVPRGLAQPRGRIFAARSRIFVAFQEELRLPMPRSNNPASKKKSYSQI